MYLASLEALLWMVMLCSCYRLSLSKTLIAPDTDTSHHNRPITSSVLNKTLQKITSNNFGSEIYNDTLDVSNNNGIINSSTQNTSINTVQEIAWNNITVQRSDQLVMGNASKQCPSCKCGSNNNRKKRIAGGITAEQNEFPWMVALTSYNDSNGGYMFHCGAIVITQQHLLTAAHCFNNSINKRTAENIVARLGAHDLGVHEPNAVLMNITKVIQHPEFQYHQLEFDMNRKLLYNPFKNDIAILKLKSPILFNTSFIRPACLSKSENQNYSGLISTITGWGEFNDSFEIENTTKVERNWKLHKVEAPIISVEDCRKNDTVISLEITDKMVCVDTAGGKDACQGDSGGPLQISGIMEVIVFITMEPFVDCMLTVSILFLQDFSKRPERNSMTGVTSSGVGCGRGFPGIYTQIASYIRWVEENIDEECLCTS